MWNKHSELVRLLRSISDDLTTMLRIKVVSGATGNCAAPIALYSLASMGFVGYLISPEGLPAHEYVQRVMACIEYSYSDRNITEFDAVLNTSIITQLYDGLVFFFIPPFIGIGRELEDFLVFTPGQCALAAIDADRLAKMLVQFVRELESVMLTDAGLRARMWKRLMSFRKLDEPVE